MQTEAIIEVGIDDLNRLYVCPAITGFDHIYRAGMQVRWDSRGSRLVSPVPREWSHLRWFEQIVAAVSGEYGVQLIPTPQTLWSNVPEALTAAISNCG